VALVTELEEHQLLATARHTAVRCTYSIVTDDEGRPCLQLDTYGSSTRKILGKKSQSLRFSPEAIEQLRAVIEQLVESGTDHGRTPR